MRRSPRPCANRSRRTRQRWPQPAPPASPPRLNDGSGIDVQPLPLLLPPLGIEADGGSSRQTWVRRRLGRHGPWDDYTIATPVRQPCCYETSGRATRPLSCRSRSRPDRARSSREVPFGSELPRGVGSRQQRLVRRPLGQRQRLRRHDLNGTGIEHEAPLKGRDWTDVRCIGHLRRRAQEAMGEPVEMLRAIPSGRCVEQRRVDPIEAERQVEVVEDLQWVGLESPFRVT
jgi:hypothetical protein